MQTELENLRRENEALRAELAAANASTLETLIAAQQKQFEIERGQYELRSDTLTKPTPAMRAAMATAEVGDAVWGTDPTVKRLEAHIASLCGKEAALLVPSGVMGNLICVLCHCDARVSEVILGDKAHQLLYETGNLSNIGGIQTRPLPNQDDGTIPVELIASSLRGIDQHWPTTRAVLLENTHNFTGGKVLPLEYVSKVRKVCDEHIYRVALHCDGARAWHAAVALGVSMKALLADFDTASLCLSKGLGAPIGSVIVGPKNLIDGKARRLVKMLGGGMRQTGIIAAAGLFAVDHNFLRLASDHAIASKLYVALQGRGVDGIKPQTNILIWHSPNPGTAAQVVEKCAAEGVRIGSIGASLVRAIPHLGCGIDTDSDIDRIADIVSRAHASITAS